MQHDICIINLKKKMHLHLQYEFFFSRLPKSDKKKTFLHVKYIIFFALIIKCAGNQLHHKLHKLSDNISTLTYHYNPMADF